MTESTTTVLPDKTVPIPFGGFFANLIAGLFITGLAVGAFLFPALVPQTWAMVVGWSLGSLLVFGLVFFPISIAMDVGDRIPEIEEARKNDEELKEIQIRHPQLWAIVLLNIASFWSGIGWIIAMAWACSPGKVAIPDKVFSKVFDNTNSEKPDAQQGHPTESISGPSCLETELIEIKRLEEKGLLSKEEADNRRKLILSR